MSGSNVSNVSLIEIAADAVRETEKAIQLYDGGVKAWVPKSLVEQNPDGTWTMPEWLARERGFI